MDRRLFVNNIEVVFLLVQVLRCLFPSYSDSKVKSRDELICLCRNQYCCRRCEEISGDKYMVISIYYIKKNACAVELEASLGKLWVQE